MALMTRAYEIPRAEPVIITIGNEASPPPVNNAEEKDDCSCGVPPNASKQVHTVSLCSQVERQRMATPNLKGPINVKLMVRLVLSEPSIPINRRAYHIVVLMMAGLSEIHSLSTNLTMAFIQIYALVMLLVRGCLSFTTS